MNEKSLDVLKQYDIDVYKTMRGRGGMLLFTNQGVKLFLECNHPDKYYEREDIITKTIAHNGFINVDTYIRNADGGLVSENEEDGRRYILKNWVDARECNVNDISDIAAGVSTLARLHTSLDEAAVCFREMDVNPVAENMRLADNYVRHMKELKQASNYLKNKKKKSEFENIAYRNIGSFYSEAVNAGRKMSDDKLKKRFLQAQLSGELVHGNYTYHNVCFCGSTVFVTNFEKCRNECQISDLYQFMRKILEKYEWDIQTAYKMLDEYDKVKPVSDIDLELLGVLFSFPEKFWKIINYYYNMNKAWIPPKSVEKLKAVTSVNSRRLEFLASIGAL